MKDKHIRLSSEQYIIDENNCITIPYSVLYNAGLGGVPEFNIMEKNAYEYVYSIIPSTDTKEGWGFVQKVNCSEETGIKIDVTGMFELKPGDSVSVDVYEFELFLFDRVAVLKDKREQEEDKEFDSQLSKLTDDKNRKKVFDELDKSFEDCGIDPYDLADDALDILRDDINKKFKKGRGSDPYAPDENTINMMRDNLNKKFNKDFEKLDKVLGNLLNEILSNSTKKLHTSKDPLLNEFINDMLARVYGKDGQKVIMISNTELQEFIDDMTWWYNRIKKGK